MRTISWAWIATALTGCTIYKTVYVDETGIDSEPPSTDTEETDTDVEETGDTHTDTDTTEPPCVDDADGELPPNAEWLILDGLSTQLYSFSANVLDDAYPGNHGTYDLDALEVYGGNGFRLPAPATIVGAQARWTNLLEDDTPAVLYAWPDFSSDGYAFDVDAPYGTYTRCLGPADDLEWITYVFPEPFEVDQPLHVFAGMYRGQVFDGDFVEPEIPFEDTYLEAEPLHAGLKWPDLDDELYYGGLATPWYTWQVRLAVILHDDLAPEDKPFFVDEALTASSRAAWGDYDHDGDDDLMTNGPTLYQNNGDGSFTDVTATAIPAGTTASSDGGIWGDYDNDGCLDYFGKGGSYTAGEVLLHSNCDGTFTDVIDTSGIDDTQDLRDCDGDGQPEHSPTEGAGWADIDGDGDLDLYLANYECSSEYDYFLNYTDRLFLNQGDGTFLDADEGVGIDTTQQAGRGVTVGDFDMDGDVDLFVSNYRLDRNFFYDNRGDGTLDDVASANGTQGVEVWGAYGHTIGTAVGDIDNDGDFDLIAANLAHPFYYHFSNKTMVLVNDGSGAFTDETPSRGIYYRETHSNPTLFDADNDGDLDLFITSVYASRDSDYYDNDGTGVFTLQNYESGLVVDNGWGAAASDVDNDGDVDLVAYDLFRNRGNANHWVQVRAVGPGSAIGAVIEVEAGGQVQLRMVSGGSGTTSQDSFTQHVGLGPATTVDRITVYFPYGPTVEVTDVAADQRVWVYDDGTTGTGMAPPR